MATAFKTLRFVSRLAAPRCAYHLSRRPVRLRNGLIQIPSFRTTDLLRTQNRPEDGESIAPFPAAGGGAPLEGDEELEDDDEGESGEQLETTGDGDDVYDEEAELEELEDELADLDDIDEDDEDLDNEEEDDYQITVLDDEEGELEHDEEGNIIASRRDGEVTSGDEEDDEENGVRYEEFDIEETQPDEGEEDNDELFELDGDFDEDQEEPNWPPNFWSMDEERDDPGEEPEFEHDDITSLAHGELEQHRELREFGRVMAWDMPLLYNQARPFEPPTAAQPLRFRYTTYLGEAHPAARKVVLTFDPAALPDLNPIQTSKLIKLLGVRYNPSTTTAKMSCELYPTTAQNKRYLGDLLDKLLHECRTGADNFADVPFDFRHHKPKIRHLFPEAWKLTPEKRQALEQRREQLRLSEELAVAQGLLVEGQRLVDDLQRTPVVSEREAVLQMASANAAGQKSSTQQRRMTRMR